MERETIIKEASDKYQAAKRRVRQMDNLSAPIPMEISDDDDVDDGDDSDYDNSNAEDDEDY